ncbi:MAG: YggS family pyridoxal phosphate-dependent enzyme [Clostridia bacterium]|nr:MAG: YggS family pyridoxal phosphate-dependent enzyme [Clostridia bacterium]
MSEIAANLARVGERIAAACRRSGRDPSQVRLISVTKNVPVERMQEAIASGVTAVGENRVQEAVAKYAQLGHAVEWHLIGYLQTNKVRQLLPWVHLIHSLDRLGLAAELQRQAERTDQEAIRVLLQVNVAGEISKHGLAPGEVMPFLHRLADYPRLKVCGLMTIAPLTGNSEDTRPVFRELRLLGERIAAGARPGVEMQYLSMGMSQDFEVAIEEGSNMVRIGTAIFGRR